MFSKHTAFHPLQSSPQPNHYASFSRSLHYKALSKILRVKSIKHSSTQYKNYHARQVLNQLLPLVSKDLAQALLLSLWQSSAFWFLLPSQLSILHGQPHVVQTLFSYGHPVPGNKQVDMLF